MKAGTLTFHSPNNNGSFLQAYALQRVLLELGMQNEIINFYSEKQEEQYSVFRKNNSASNILKNVISLAHYSGLHKRFQKFNEIRNNYLILTPRLKTEDEVYKVAENYDVIICGSDQIWNTSARDFSDAYFLPGISNKKITYAVSCGSHIEAVDIGKILNYAKGFSQNSFRERNTLMEFQKLGLKSSKVVLDPTLLLNAEKYNTLIKSKLKRRVRAEKYVFLYAINYSDQVLKTAKTIGEALNLPIITLFTGYSVYKCMKYGIKVIYDATPDLFLWLTKNASVCCTNSFHGTAFSILYHKEFYRLCDKDESGNYIYDDRIDGLLGELGILDNKIGVGDALNRYTPDYNDIEKKLDSLRHESISYLTDALDVKGLVV